MDEERRELWVGGLVVRVLMASEQSEPDEARRDGETRRRGWCSGNGCL
jgi:hypothetical protein